MGVRYVASLELHFLHPLQSNHLLRDKLAVGRSAGLQNQPGTFNPNSMPRPAVLSSFRPFARSRVLLLTVPFPLNIWGFLASGDVSGSGCTYMCDHHCGDGSDTRLLKTERSTCGG